MAKTKISEYDSIAANNTDIDGVNISEGCSPANINNALREQMAHLKDLQAGLSGDTIPVASGGTGSGTASGARTNLGLGALATLATVDTAQIAADAVDGTKIADDSIDSEHYVDGSIDTVHIADDAVTSAKIADSSVTTAKIADASITSAKLSSGVGGKVLQVFHATKTDTQTITNSLTFQDISSLSISITPSSASNKILCMWSVNIGNGDDQSHCYLRLYRDSTSIGAAAAASNRTTAISVVNTSDGGQMQNVSGSYLDSPSTTSAVTYKLAAAGNAGTAALSYINRSGRDTDSANNDGRGSSFLTIMEIEG